MRTMLALAFIVLSANQIFGHPTHNCIHDTIEHKFVHHEVLTDEVFSRRSLADVTWTPICIVPNYDFLSGVTNAQTTFLKTKLIPDVISFFSKALSIVRYNTAGKITIPAGNCFDAPVPSSYTTSPGVSGDFVLFVYALSPNGGALAWGGPCFLGNDNRPIAGVVNFNAASINPDPATYANQLGIIQHEITHSLGFSASLYGYFKTAPATKAVNWRGTNGSII